MKCYIDGNYRGEQNFWRELQGLASQEQKNRLLDGCKVMIGGRTYQVITDTEENETKERV